MNRSLALLFIATFALSGCGSRVTDPEKRLEQGPPNIGLSPTEPTPEEVATAREHGEEHPTVNLAPETKTPAVEPKINSEPKPDPAANAKAKKMSFVLGTNTNADKKGGGDDDYGLSFCHTAKWSNACLTGLLIYRCGQYAFPLTPFGCAATSMSLVELLELERIDVTLEDDEGKEHTYSLPVIFTKRLTRMIEDPTIQGDVRELSIAVRAASQTKTKFDLWNWVLARKGGNTEKTLEWLSVMLQDTSAIQIQVEYLRLLDKNGKLSTNAQRTTDTLSELSDFLSYENLLKIDWQSWLTLYPAMKNVETEATPLIYHLYPMSYLSALLKKAYGNRLGSFLPFLFNTEYLNQDLDPEMWPLHHPRPEKIDLKQGRIQWKMRDMYAGFAGALFGVGKPNRSPGLVKFEEAYAKNPFRTMQTLFWTMP